LLTIAHYAKRLVGVYWNDEWIGDGAALSSNVIISKKKEATLLPCHIPGC
jgi:hypothetical protein